ncbi:MAG: flagellar protein FliT [gamma proteobacterium symbiont of Bathyaustriella thionipta]|nr:flagellar protein FliT [gamma proteobacterium symbiont of Bathyaustriella thionipta]MCU7949033.1 flagellar protein FliT [gamma proteobacterium symbiont of Bathyaustriella thionipta]MCU7954520.1 flagellar protein FliT [gamma proteobacterium symbiont of Bathyaustriella thionipta]MCU7955617.1 flagellar protein FliT [gamma proteobacterium symbiont of Bathyaustriella thionipta]MCU7968615.1 flagellar protein FliT [gamma proteobacterium symbiont of Bathyaustriella thionipta]
MFFSEQRQQFFKPLTSKYREQVIECLRLLYERLYSANADYGESLRRNQVIEIYEEALARAPTMEAEQDKADDETTPRFKQPRDLASWILNLLIDNGWIEKQVDQVTFQSTYPFSRMGRLFTQALVEANQTKVRTRHRNTRNTLNALDAFLSRGEVHDLLDAYEYSEQIIADFTDVIAELEERKRELVREVEAQVLVQQASEHFFDFMEKRFQPDLSIRLSADSVEKHRDQIEQTIAKIRRKRKEFKKQAEIRLRQVAPELLASPEHSILWHILDTIELRMRKAADTMLPALRRALQGFTKRADIIIRQIAYLGGQNQSDVLSVCETLKNLDEAETNTRLTQAAAQISPMNLRLIDPQQVVLPERRRKQVVQTAVADEEQLDENARRDLVIQQLLDQAFSIRNDDLKQYLLEKLQHTLLPDKAQQAQPINTADLPIKTADDLLAMAHAIELGAVNQMSLDYCFHVEPVGKQNKNDYFERFDEFHISLKKIIANKP